MGRLFNVEISESKPIHFRYLTDEDLIQNIKSQANFDDFLIYFLCRIKKLRFDLSDIKIDGHYLELTIIVGGTERKRFAFFYDESEFSIDYKLSTEKELVIDIKGELEKYYLISETVGQILNLKFGIRPEIIYIGESIDIISRLQKHEKIIEITSKLSDDDELRIYINSFRYSYLAADTNNMLFAIRNLELNKKNLDKNEIKDIMHLTERVLIHFFQPIFNDNHKDFKIVSDSLVKKILLKQNVTMLYISFDLDSEFYDFYSANQALSEKTFYFNFKKPSSGYISGRPPFDEI